MALIGVIMDYIYCFVVIQQKWKRITFRIFPNIYLSLPTLVSLSSVSWLNTSEYIHWLVEAFADGPMALPPAAPIHLCRSNRASS